MAKAARNKADNAKSSSAKGAGLRANIAASEQEFDDVEPLFDLGAHRDIAGVILATIAVVSFIAVISPSTAPVAHAIAGFYHLGFGLLAYILPLIMLVASVLIFLRGRIALGVRTYAGAGVVFIAVCVLLALVLGQTSSSGDFFVPEHLAAAGGLVGGVIANTLQGALGKVISIVISLGLIALGLVILGFSVGEPLQAAAGAARDLRERHRVDVNANPWGDAVAQETAEKDVSADDACSPVRPRRQGGIFDVGAIKTTFLGGRATTVIDDESEDEGNEDPFVNVTARPKPDSAKTTLLAGRGKNGSKVEAFPGQDTSREDGDLDTPDVLDVAEDELPWEAPAKTATAQSKVHPSPKPSRKVAAPAAASAKHQPIPEFLAASQPASDASAPSALVCPATASDDDPERQLPPASMLRHNPQAAIKSSTTDKELEQTATSLQSTLREFGLRSSVVGWIAGPTVTTFKVQPGEGERVSRINSLEDDIALTLATDSVRIFAPIPGTSLVGIEIPNRTRQTVGFGDILPYVQGGPLEFALGRDAEGAPMVADLAKMPHLLIAGTTGSGKSVVISSIVMSLLMRTFPEDVRMIMIDPKRVEFAPYDGLPHLYVPVVTEPKQAASALQWAVSEMERRLKIFERIGVRKIATFNEKQAAGEFEKYDNPPAKMPYLVIVIDELSDLMMVAGKDVEASIVRIAQLGRAAGIHMIVATQRPSSNVVTGLIKANITNRIGLTVATGIDSRVILDQTGAEKLTGQGDMLFSRVDWGKPKRIQGCYVSDEEIVSVVDFVKEHSRAEYHEEILSAVAPAPLGAGGGNTMTMPGDAAEDDPLLWDAARIVVDSQLGSTSGLQRRLKVGYARAGRIMDMLEEKGVVGPPDGSKPREVLLDMEALQALEALESPLTEEEIGGF